MTNDTWIKKILVEDGGVVFFYPYGADTECFGNKNLPDIVQLRGYVLEFDLWL